MSVFTRANRRLFRAGRNLLGRARDSRRVTFLPAEQSSDLTRILSGFNLEQLRPLARQLRGVSNLWIDHYFDLLGSGWTKVEHGMRCRGLEGHQYSSGARPQIDAEGRWLRGRITPANLDESTRVWRAVDRGYSPIDWQLDFKSGYRWSERTWHADIKFGHAAGADVKVPWELARMQHLPQLAHAYSLAVNGESGFRLPEVYIREFRNQVLDFVATNPPRFGVNWHCSMDVGIRAVNWLVAYDLFRAYGAKFDAEFERIVARSISEHASHIATHPEKYGALRGNHYLAGVTGLLFASAYLPGTPESDAWLALAVDELVAEVEYQFHDDGANFEGSTCYHMLSAEMVAFATALVLGLPSEKRAALRGSSSEIYTRGLSADDPESSLNVFPSWYLQRLQKIVAFTVHVTKPSGCVHQVGDNDSGRLLKIQPAYHEMTVAQAKSTYGNLQAYDQLADSDPYWVEDHLDHSSLVAAYAGLLDQDFSSRVPDQLQGSAFARGVDRRLEYGAVRQLAGGRPCRRQDQTEIVIGAAHVRIGDGLDFHERLTTLQADRQLQRSQQSVAIHGDDLALAPCCLGYPDFGLFIFRWPNVYLAIRCGSARDHVAHAHNDQLAVELSVRDDDLIVDPGTYVYTPCVERRDAYRSALAHAVPVSVDYGEPRSLALGIFSLVRVPIAECVYFGPSGFIGRCRTGDHFVYRTVFHGSESITIADFSPIGSSNGHRNATGGNSRALPESPGYGVLSIN